MESDVNRVEKGQGVSSESIDSAANVRLINTDDTLHLVVNATADSQTGSKGTKPASGVAQYDDSNISSENSPIAHIELSPSNDAMVNDNKKLVESKVSGKTTNGDNKSANNGSFSKRKLPRHQFKTTRPVAGPRSSLWKKHIDIGDAPGWICWLISTIFVYGVCLPLFGMSIATLNESPQEFAKDESNKVSAATALYEAGKMTQLQLDAVALKSNMAVTEIQDKAAIVWYYTLSMFAFTVTVTLVCAAFVYWLRDQPAVRALGKLFLTQFFVGNMFFAVTNIMCVGFMLLQIIDDIPVPVERVQHYTWIMVALRHVLGSFAFSCFLMRQRVIYMIFNMLSMNANRVYLEAFVFFTVISALAVIPSAVATFVPSQSDAHYRYLGNYLIMIAFTVPFYYWTLKTTQASRKFNDYHSNIRMHLPLTLLLVSASLYNTFHPTSMVGVLAIGYSVSCSTTIYAVELAMKALQSKYVHKEEPLTTNSKKGRPLSQYHSHSARFQAASQSSRPGNSEAVVVHLSMSDKHSEAVEVTVDREQSPSIVPAGAVGSHSLATLD